MSKNSTAKRPRKQTPERKPRKANKLMREAREYIEAAELIVTVFNRSKAPEFLTNLMMRGLNDAATVKGVDIWEAKSGEAKDFDLAGLANLIAVSQSNGTYPHVNDLAIHVRAILNHAETPAALYNAVQHFVIDSVRIKDSDGQSLLDRWSNFPETIAAGLCWAQEADDRDQDRQKLLNSDNGKAVQNG